jgi:hypothetical protein
MEYENILSEDEMGVRKIWLRLLVASTCMTTFFMLSKIVDGANDTRVRSTPQIIGWFLGCAIASAFYVFVNWIVYRCAYKKPGTKLLTLGLVFFPFAVFRGIADLFSFVKDFGAEDPVFMKYGIIATWLVSFVVSIYWFIYSCRLRSVNKKIKHYKTHLQPQEQLQGTS